MKIYNAIMLTVITVCLIWERAERKEKYSQNREITQSAVSTNESPKIVDVRIVGSDKPLMVETEKPVQISGAVEISKPVSLDSDAAVMISRPVAVVVANTKPIQVEAEITGPLYSNLGGHKGLGVVIVNK